MVASAKPRTKVVMHHKVPAGQARVGDGARGRGDAVGEVGVRVRRRSSGSCGGAQMHNGEQERKRAALAQRRHRSEADQGVAGSKSVSEMFGPGRSEHAATAPRADGVSAAHLGACRQGTCANLQTGVRGRAQGSSTAHAVQARVVPPGISPPGRQEATRARLRGHATRRQRNGARLSCAHTAAARRKRPAARARRCDRAGARWPRYAPRATRAERQNAAGNAPRGARNLPASAGSAAPGALKWPLMASKVAT